MVYKLYLDGNSIDSDFGMPVTISKTFIGKYGDALKEAEKMLSMIDDGFVNVLEVELNKKDKSVYLAVKELTESGIKSKRYELNY